MTLEQSRALSALPAVKRVAVARDLVEKLGRAVRIDDAVRAPIIEVVIVTTTIATSIQHESDSDDGHHDEDCGWLLLLFSRPQSHVARTHALDKALDAGEEDCNQLPRRNLLEQHRAAAALEARLRARRKGPAASYTHQEPSPRRPVRGCRPVSRLLRPATKDWT